jgi:hypothetical protein
MRFCSKIVSIANGEQKHSHSSTNSSTRTHQTSPHLIRDAGCRWSVAHRAQSRLAWEVSQKCNNHKLASQTAFD